MEETAQRIIDAAIYVFNDNLSATLDAVADKAGVTRRTLNRYFKERAQLIESCKTEMLQTCEQAMNTAFNSNTDPLKQLEMMLYAGIDCGYKYAFLNKLKQQSIPVQEEVCNDQMDNVKQKWFSLVAALQKNGVVDSKLTLWWIFVLFGGMINSTIDALRSGNVAQHDIKKFAWFSFSRSIGITF
ncbi:TetR/AcrR family transcriptional regulator [Chitinophaga sp. RAB17]|uniref:TetR/AcrR family transcriptional regulator n=1 Tax=Chitinophaga sp. RAB17 TaxID=3233049 RepID=UPI003F908D46